MIDSYKEVKECIYLIDVYTKNEQSDLTEKEKTMLKKLVDVLKEEWLWDFMKI